MNATDTYQIQKVYHSGYFLKSYFCNNPHSNSLLFYNVGERLALTLRYLATGDNLHILAYGFRVASSTACIITRNTAIAIYEKLAPTYLVVPNADQWKRVTMDYYTK